MSCCARWTTCTPTLAPDYFRSASRSDGEWVRLMEENHGAVFVAEPAAEDGAIAVLMARIYDTPDDPVMVQRRRLHIETVVVSREAPAAGDRAAPHGRGRWRGDAATARSRWC